MKPQRILRTVPGGVERVSIWYKVADEDFIRHRMQTQGYNGPRLAAGAGCSRQMISYLARGERTCKADLAEKIAELLELPRDAIFVRSVSRTALKTSTNVPKKAA